MIHESSKKFQKISRAPYRPPTVWGILEDRRINPKVESTRLNLDLPQEDSSLIFFIWIFRFYNYYYNWSRGHKTVQFWEILFMAKPTFFGRLFWSTNNSIKDTGNGTLVFEAKVDNLTSKKFWSLMWAENEFWKNTVTDLNMRMVT